MANADLFKWSLANMINIDLDFMCHKLALLPPSKANCAEKVQTRERKASDNRSRGDLTRPSRVH